MNDIDILKQQIEALSVRVAFLEVLCFDKNTKTTNTSLRGISPPVLAFPRVLESVSQSTGISKEQILNMADRKRDITQARWIVWHILKSRHNWSYWRIAQRFKCDHTTVFHGCRQAQVLWGVK